jgi:hypothetical protein
MHGAWMGWHAARMGVNTKLICNSNSVWNIQKRTRIKPLVYSLGKWIVSVEFGQKYFGNLSDTWLWCWGFVWRIPSHAVVRVT